MSPLHRFTERIESAELLDPVASTVRRLAGPLGRPSMLRDLLTGRWLGHSVHPMIVAVPIGSWIGSAVLDATGGSPEASRRLVGLGALAAVPSTATGTADWFDTSGAEGRVGVAHAALNDVAVALFATSWYVRRNGRSPLAIGLSLVGLGAVGVAGYLGGHLAYSRGVGVNTTAFQSGPSEWTRLVERGGLPVDEPVGATVDGLEFVVVARDDRVDVLESRCTHRGAPLADGTVAGDCVVCPWHASRFDTEDGTVDAGPASVPQPAYRTRVVDGWVEVRRREVGGLRRNPVGASR